MLKVWTGEKDLRPEILNLGGPCVLVVDGGSGGVADNFVVEFQVSGFKGINDNQINMAGIEKVYILHQKCSRNIHL